MRLSDIKGDRVFDVIADLIEPVANIAQDPEITLFRREAIPNGTTAKDFAVKKILRNAPLLLRRHKTDISTILASIKGVHAEEYLASLNMAQLSVDLIDLLNDAEFANFFTSAARTLTPSGDASGNTAAPAV